MDNNEVTAHNLANIYSEYVKVDISKEVSAVEEIIDDTLTRLEEFKSIIEMMRTDTNYVVVENILSRRGELLALCEKVHKLEALVSRVHQDVNVIETQVMEAEQDIKYNSEGKLRSMLRPLLFMKPDLLPSTPRSNRLPPYLPPDIFKTSDFFPASDKKADEQ